MDHIIEAKNVCMDFKIGDGSVVHALKGIDLQIRPNKLSVLRGRSGSGKTTLINILGALDRPTSGEVIFMEEGNDITKLSDPERDRLRRFDMAFVFQSVALISTMTAFENVEFALRLTKLPYRKRGGKRLCNGDHRYALAKRLHVLYFKRGAYRKCNKA